MEFRGRSNDLLPTWQGVRIFLDDYRGSLTFWTSNLLGIGFWILTNYTGISPLALVALSLHFLPMLPYYHIYGPFAISMDYTPMTDGDGQREPDLRAMKAGEALLSDGKASIHVRVNISTRLDEFSLQFSTPEDLDVELRDIPMAEHVYDRDERIFSATNISNWEFTVVLDIYALSTQSGEKYPLTIVDTLNNQPIETIDIIA